MSTQPIHRFVVLLIVASGLLVTSVVAQSRRKKDNKQNSQTLELRAKQAEEALAKEYISVATGFYDLGDVEKAKDFLIRLNDLKSGLPGVKEKIDELDEELMSSNSDKFTLDVSKGWGAAVAEVTKGDPFRIVASGDYKLSVQLSLDVNGLPGKDPIRDLAGGVPFGALMGIIQGADGKPSRPFAIKSGVEHSPRKTGVLFLRVNAPPTAKCTGKLQVQVSGKVVTRGTGKKKSKR